MEMEWPTREELGIEHRKYSFDESIITNTEWRLGDIDSSGIVEHIQTGLVSWFVCDDIIHYITENGSQYMITQLDSDTNQNIFILIAVGARRWNAYRAGFANYFGKLFVSVGKEFLMQHLDKRIEG